MAPKAGGRALRAGCNNPGAHILATLQQRCNHLGKHCIARNLREQCHNRSVRHHQSKGSIANTGPAHSRGSTETKYTWLLSRTCRSPEIKASPLAVTPAKEDVPLTVRLESKAAPSTCVNEGRRAGHRTINAGTLRTQLNKRSKRSPTASA